MASVTDAYLPGLSECFLGDAIVFSWEDIYRTLRNGNRDVHTETRVANLLAASPEVRSILSQKVPSFSPPSQQARNRLETKTTPIESVPTKSKLNPVENIKADALWLCDEVQLSEEEALRITLLEWQRAPAEQLTSGYSEAELASLRDAFGSVESTISQRIDQIFVRRQEEDIHSVDQRRRRLLLIYFKETAGILGVSKELQEICMLDKHQPITVGPLLRFARECEQLTATIDSVADLTNAIDTRLRSLNDGRSWSIQAEEITSIWIASEFYCIQLLQEMLLLRLRGSAQSVSAEVLIRWLHIMSGCDFFASVQPGPFLGTTQIEMVQMLASVTTVAMMDPATALNCLSDHPTSVDPQLYFINTDTANEVHSILFTAAEACIPQAAPAALAWGLILGEIRRAASIAKEARENGAMQRAIDQVNTYDSTTGRRVSSGSLQQSVFEDVIDSLMTTSPVQDPASYVLRCTIEAGHVFDTIQLLASTTDGQVTLLGALRLQILQELLFVVVSDIGYTPDILSAQFSILATSNASSEQGIPDAAETFIKNDFLMDNFFAVAAARFPYESLPFLRLCRLLASSQIFDEHGAQYITFRLRALDTYTQIATGPLASYHTIREDENLNLVALDGTASMLRGTQKQLLTFGQSQPTAAIIPADTIGEVISESSPPVIKWQHSYSGVALLGMWLELYYLGQLQLVLSPYESADEVVTECICILVALLKSTTLAHPKTRLQGDSTKPSQQLLEEASASLETDSDVVDYIFEILEQEMQAYRRRPSNAFNTSVLVSCIEFIATICHIQPGKFWPAFSKSSLLESYGSDSFLMSIVMGVEVPNQKFPFLSACSNLLKEILNSTTQLHTNGNSQILLGKGRKPQLQHIRIQSTALLALTQSLYGVFEAIPGWSFTPVDQQVSIVNTLSSSFEKIIFNAYGVGQDSSALRLSFKSAADFLTQHIRASADDLTSTTSMLFHIVRLEEQRAYRQEMVNIEFHDEALKSLLSLSQTIIRLGELTAGNPSALEMQLFDIVPLLCRDLARSVDETRIRLIQDLLDSLRLIESVSLLGHLGSTSLVALLEVLKLSLGGENTGSLDAAIWSLLTRMIGRNQQWLAIVVLTGSPPERGNTNGQIPSSNSLSLKGKTFMEIAFSQLSKIAELDPEVAVSMLNFIAQAQQNWSWASGSIDTNKKFLPAILSYICNTYVDVSDEFKTSHRNRIAALATDISTTRLHYAKAQRDSTVLKTITPLVKWLSSNAINTNSYNHSLHTNLRRNFASRFEGLDISDFKRTGSHQASYGKNYYYDIEFAGQVLSADKHWDRRDSPRDQSFFAEVCRANLNLSVVDSEIKLLKSFLHMSVEHCGYFAQDRDLQKVMAEIVNNCLSANMQPYPAESLFENVLQTRADLAIALLQRLVEAKAKASELRALLKSAWDCTQCGNGSFEKALINGDLEYWRSMLTITLLALQFHVDRRYMPPAADASPGALLRHSQQAVPTILEIVSVVIGQGFRSVAAALQDQKQSGRSSGQAPQENVSHRDVLLILTIFDTVLRMTRLPEFVSEASQRLITENAIQSGLLLYSWSHLLIGSEGNEGLVYASYALWFLASASSLPPVTEEMAVEGILGRILSTRMTQKLQSISDGAGHLEKRQGVQGLYTLWATGMLPICLNMLRSVGAPVAAEVSNFVNQFPGQLSRASTAFIPASHARSGNSTVITLTSAKEAASLSLISFVLESFRNAGASAAVDPATIQPLLEYDEHKKALADDVSDVVSSAPATLRNRIVPTDENEAAMAKEKHAEGLTNKVVAELKNALICLRGGRLEEDDDK